VSTNSALPVFEIPKGKVALAVQLPYVQGMAGSSRPHDKVNLFGTVKPGSPVKASLTPPRRPSSSCRHRSALRERAVGRNPTPPRCRPPRRSCCR